MDDCFLSIICCLNCNISFRAVRASFYPHGPCDPFDPCDRLGPLPLLLLGITYATVKEDDCEGLSYPRFLDAVLEMAFECGRNVAADLQAGAMERRAKEEAMQVGREE